ncbi:MAG: MBL fold metallo-hydrolase [Firmicutes bacterium]|nr:MBL fold metallo-hydrolase [Bacillota bacterium]MDY5531284.1 MBL fold metallo-hydrolase [Pumilibacteraceae bacterium]
MCIRVCSLGSGSKGNCIYVGYGSTHILVDAGLSLKRIEKSLAALGVDPKGNLFVLVTHEHSDHIKSLAALYEKYAPKVFVGRGSEAGVTGSLGKVAENFVYYEMQDFFVGSFTVTPFAVSHDVPCVGYTLSAGGKSVSVVTDIGKITPSVLKSVTGSDLVVLESNHDVEMLKRNTKYSAFLKKRIASDKGHLSNDDCAETACLLAASGTKQIILAHLSEENNCAELAFETVCKKLESRGYVEGKDVKIDVAEQNSLTALYEIS